jgi:hypothetical protein
MPIQRSSSAVHGEVLERGHQCSRSAFIVKPLLAKRN